MLVLLSGSLNVLGFKSKKVKETSKYKLAVFYIQDVLLFFFFWHGCHCSILHWLFLF